MRSSKSCAWCALQMEDDLDLIYCSKFCEKEAQLWEEVGLEEGTLDD